MLEDISHLLFLAVLLVHQACLQDSDLHILQGVIRLVKMCRYRKVIPAVDHIPAVSLNRSAILRPVSPIYTVDGHFSHVKQYTTFSVVQV